MEANARENVTVTPCRRCKDSARRNAKGVLGILALVAVLTGCLLTRILAGPASQAQQVESLKLVGHLGGGSSHLNVQGDYAYLGAGPELAIMDISDPSSPTRVGYVMLPDTTQEIVVAGTYAYVADREGGLRIVDASDPTNPFEVGSLDLMEKARGIAVAGSHAFVVTTDGSLRVVDIDDCVNPDEVGWLSLGEDAWGMGIALTADRSRAFVAARRGGLLAVDITDPIHPAQLGWLDTPGLAHDVAISGTVAYVADYEEGVRVVDISDPTEMSERGHRGTSRAKNVDLVGQLLYVADDTGGLRVLDVSDPANIEQIGSYNTTGWARDVVVTGSLAYVADYLALRVFDVDDPTSPVLLGSAEYPPEVWGVEAGDLVYVSDLRRSLEVVDVADPADPKPIGWSGGGARNVALADDYAYVAARTNGLRVVDVSDPTSPVETGICDTPGSARDVVVIHPYAYVADEDGGLRVIHVGDPASPTEVGSVELAGPALGVTVAGSYAYVASGSGGLRVIDVADPAQPAEIGSIGTPGNTQGVAVTGTYACVAEGSSGVRMIEIGDPSNPTEVGLYDTPGSAQAVALYDSLAYVADGTGGLRVIDIREPSNLFEVEAYVTPANFRDVSVNESAVYVAGWGYGLFVFEHAGPVVPIAGLVASNDSPTPLGSPTTLTATVSDGSNVAYTWSFGDGDTGSGAGVSHTYPKIGVHTATVTAANSVSVVSDTTVVTIADVPIAGLAAVNDSPTLLGRPTTLMATITAGSNVTYTWSLGDGDVGSGSTIAHTYPAIGTYTAVVTASNSIGAVTDATSVSINYGAYFPLVVRRWPPLPYQPTMYSIGNADGDGSYTVSWTEQPSRLADAYTLEEATNSAFTSDLRKVCTTYSQSCHVSGRAAGTYYYRVRGHNAWGTGQYSGVASVAVLPPATPVINPIENADGDGSYIVSWNASARANHYILQEDTDELFTSPTNVHEGPATWWSAAGKTAGTYYYRLRAHGPTGHSEWSGTRTVNVLPPATPNLASIGNADQDQDYTVAWNATARATSYRLQEDTDPGFGSPQTVYQGLARSWNATGRTPDTYYYRVQAIGTTGQSGWSGKRQITIHPLFVGLELRWDGNGYVRGSEYYDIGYHIERDCTGLTDPDTIRCHAHSWYNPNPLDFDSESWDSYYSVSTGFFRSSSSPADPSWKWGCPWVLPYDWAFQDGDTFKIGGQRFKVTGPHSGYTAFGRAVQYWKLVNRDRFLLWDGGGDWKQYVWSGDATLHYDAGNSRLLLHRDVLRTFYYEGDRTDDTVQYIDNLTSANAFPAQATNSALSHLLRETLRSGRVQSSRPGSTHVELLGAAIRANQARHPPAGSNEGTHAPAEAPRLSALGQELPMLGDSYRR